MTYTPYYAGGWQDTPSTATPIDAAALNNMEAGIVAANAGFMKLAGSTAAGTGLINGTQTILTWTAPNDGQLHRIQVYCALQVTSTETGGAIGLGWTQPSGNIQVAAAQLFAANIATGPQWFSASRLIAPGSTVTIAQTTALTGGASTFWAEIWGS